MQDSEFASLLLAPFAAHDYVFRTDADDAEVLRRCRIVWIEEGGEPSKEEGSSGSTSESMAMAMLDVPGESDLVPHPVKRLVRCFPAIRVAKSAYGLGVYASRPISKGEILLIEKPLLTALTDGEAEMVFYDLPLPTQMAIMGLNDPECNADRDNSHLDHPPELEMVEEKTVGSIYRNNSIPNGAGPNVASGSLFEVVCRLNHSCTPNVMWRWDPANGEEIVFAVVDISFGEELRASYVSEYMPHEKRKAKIRKNFYFDCICPLCQGTASEEGIERYETGMQLTKIVAEVERSIQSLPPPTLLHQQTRGKHHGAGKGRSEGSKGKAEAPGVHLDPIRENILEGLKLAAGKAHFEYLESQLRRFSRDLERWE
jgi:hypothetical protein